jgi:hypothetical protein
LHYGATRGRIVVDMANRKPYRPSVARKAVRLHSLAYELLVACAREEDQQLAQVLRAAVQEYAAKRNVKVPS